MFPLHRVAGTSLFLSATIHPDLYEVRMFDWDEKQVVFQQKKWGDVDGNVISYSYIPKLSEFHMMKPVQVNKKKKKNLCGYVMLFKKNSCQAKTVPPCSSQIVIQFHPASSYFDLFNRPIPRYSIPAAVYFILVEYYFFRLQNILLLLLIVFQNQVDGILCAWSLEKQLQHQYYKYHQRH